MTTLLDKKESPGRKRYGRVEFGTPECKAYQERLLNLMRTSPSHRKILPMFVKQAIDEFPDEVHEWDPVWFSLTDNATVRQKLIEYYTLEVIWEYMDAKLVDEAGEYKLYKCDLGNGVDTRILRMVCPSTNHVHTNPVKSDISTVKEALEFMNHGLTPDIFGVQT